MQLLDITMSTPEQNLAVDDALLERAEAGKTNQEVLRLWEPKQHFVVLGRSSRISQEVDIEYCHKNKIPVLRRVSGGASIVTGPGCLMYGLLLSYQQRPELRMLDQAHQFVMENLQTAFCTAGIDVRYQGTCDLTVDNLKFSGNSLRCKKDWMMYHGTVLYDFDLAMISRCLKTPPRQPEYRKQRGHDSFVSNLPIAADEIRQALVQTWQADEAAEMLPVDEIDLLVEKKYSKDSWNSLR